MKADARRLARTAVGHDGRAKAGALRAKDPDRLATHRGRPAIHAVRVRHEIIETARDLGRIRDDCERRLDRGDLRRDVQREE